MSVLSEVLGVGGWEALSPWSSPVVLAAWITVLEASASGVELDTVLARVHGLKVSDLANCLSERE